MAKRSVAHQRKDMATPASAPTVAPHHAVWSPTNRLAIESVYPEVDGGRYPVKRVVGDVLQVWADIFRDGHDVLGATLLYRTAAEPGWLRAPMLHQDNDRWSGRFKLEQNTRYVYTIEAWTDTYASWRRDILKKLEARQDVALELQEGRQIIDAAAGLTIGRGGSGMRDALARFDGAATPDARS